jgi:hypothetical protein
MTRVVHRSYVRGHLLVVVKDINSGHLVDVTRDAEGRDTFYCAVIRELSRLVLLACFGEAVGLTIKKGLRERDS